jgi:hypothetical protein
MPASERGLIRRLLRDYQHVWAEALRALDPSPTPEVARITVAATFGTVNSITLQKTSQHWRALEGLTVESACRTLG